MPAPVKSTVFLCLTGEDVRNLTTAATASGNDVADDGITLKTGRGSVYGILMGGILPILETPAPPLLLYNQLQK
jgi:hypothetical protein